MRAGGKVALVDGPLRDLIRRTHRADRQAAAKVLGDGDDIRHHAVFVLATEKLAGFAESGLRLIEDHQHAALIACRAKRLVITGRRHDDTARAEHRLANEGRGLRGEIGVGQLQTGFEALQLTLGKR